MPTYMLLADVNEQQFQSPQELGAIWGEISQEIERLGGEPQQSYVLLGEYDFQVVFDVEDDDAVLEIALAVQRHGLDTRTMRAIPTDRLGEVVDDA